MRVCSHSILCVIFVEQLRISIKCRLPPATGFNWECLFNENTCLCCVARTLHTVTLSRELMQPWNDDIASKSDFQNRWDDIKRVCNKRRWISRGGGERERQKYEWMKSLRYINNAWLCLLYHHHVVFYAHRNWFTPQRFDTIEMCASVRCLCVFFFLNILLLKFLTFLLGIANEMPRIFIAFHCYYSNR